MSLHQIKEQQRMQPMHICITGTSQGIGLAAAKNLVSQGHVVYHANRNAERSRAAVDAAGGGIPMVCDLADLDSIKRFGHALATQAPRLDVLCLNAGVAPSAQANTTPKLTAQGYEECIGVNHLGHFLLANLLRPKLAADGGGRLVMTASSVHDPDTKGGRSGGGIGATLGDMSGMGVNLKRGLLLDNTDNDAYAVDRATMVEGAVEYNGAKVYKDSKLCNILTVQEAVRRFPDVNTVAFNPGLVPTTGLFSSLREENWLKAQALTWVAQWMGVAVPVQVAGDRLIYMATAVQIPNGSYYSAPVKSLGITPADGFEAILVSKEGSDPTKAKQLWDRSLEVVKEWL